MLKVLLIMAYPPEHLGGVEIYIKNLTQKLIKKKVYFEIITTDLNHPSKHEEISVGIKIHYLKNYGSFWGKNPIFNVFPFLLKNYKNFDLIHVHSYIYFFTLQAAFFCKLINMPYILTLHGGIDTNNMKVTNIRDYLQLIFKNTIFDKIWGHYVTKTPQALISVSKSDLILASKKFNIKRDHNYWIPNAVNTNVFKKDANIQKKFLTFIGRLSTIKGFDYFLEMVKIIQKKGKNYPILIIGQGELEKLIPNDSNITYFKSIPYERMPEIYNQSKVFVLSSRFEGFPTTILEAMACETPVVSTNLGGIKDLITDNFNGFLYEPNDIASGAEKIEALWSDKSLQRKFIQNSKQLINKKFTWDKIAHKNLHVYEKFAKEKKTF